MQVTIVISMSDLVWQKKAGVGGVEAVTGEIMLSFAVLVTLFHRFSHLSSQLLKDIFMEVARHVLFFVPNRHFLFAPAKENCLSLFSVMLSTLSLQWN